MNYQRVFLEKLSKVFQYDFVVLAIGLFLGTLLGAAEFDVDYLEIQQQGEAMPASQEFAKFDMHNPFSHKDLAWEALEAKLKGRTYLICLNLNIAPEYAIQVGRLVVEYYTKLQGLNLDTKHNSTSVSSASSDSIEYRIKKNEIARKYRSALVELLGRDLAVEFSIAFNQISE